MGMDLRMVMWCEALEGCMVLQKKKNLKLKKSDPMVDMTSHRGLLPDSGMHWPYAVQTHEWIYIHVYEESENSDIYSLLKQLG